MVDLKPSGILAFSQDMVNFTECPRTGDTIFHGVTLMSEGTWTDSLNKKPLMYSAEQVSKMSFKRMAFKAQHDIYGEMPLTNEIGVIENAKLSLNPAMWKGDVRIYPTALGKDIATLIKRKQITDVSPEFFFDDILEGDKPAGITFMGAATVRKGACRVCTFNEGEAEMAKYSKDDMLKMMDFMKENPTTMDKEVMDKMYAAMDKAQRKDYMKSMINDMKAHPEMIDDEMKTSMKDMAKMSGIDTMTDPTKELAGSPGGTAAELKSGKEADIKSLESQLEAARKLKSQDVDVLGAQLEEVKKARENQANLKIESLERKVAELEATNKELITKIVDDDHKIRVKSLERQIAELSNQPVIHTTISASLSGQRVSAQLDSDPDFEPVSVRDLE